MNIIADRDVNILVPTTDIMTEFVDTPVELDQKYAKLFSLVDKSRYIVFFTGAGISTAANIPGM